MSSFTTASEPVVVSADTFLDIGNGYPADTCLPNKMIKSATIKLFDTCYDDACEKSSPPLAYGDDTFFFRSRLASLLTQHSGRDSVDPDCLVPNAGVSHGLDMLCTLFCRHKPNMSNYFVFMEDTSYFLIHGMFLDHNMNVRQVVTDEDGMCVDDLRRQLQENKAANERANSESEKMIPLFLYIIPEFHNPTGSCLSKTRRRELVALAAEFDLMIIADEVYQMLDITDYIPRPDTSGFSEEAVVPDVIAVSKTDMKKNFIPEVPDPLDPLPEPAARAKSNTLPFRSLSALNSPHVITISSFSKILAPGLRVGWVEFPSKKWADDYNDLFVAQSSSNICHFSSAVVAVLMDDSLKAPLNESLVALDVFNEDESTCPLYSHIHNLRVIYGVKYEILTSALLLYSREYLEPIEREASFGCADYSEKSRHVEAKFLPSGFHIAGYRTSDRVGGYFLWVKLPGFCSATEAEACPEGPITPAALLEISKEKYNLAFKLGNGCAVDASDAGAGHGYVRMCFARLTREELEEVGKRFCQLLADTYKSLVSK